MEFENFSSVKAKTRRSTTCQCAVARLETTLSFRVKGTQYGPFQKPKSIGADILVGRLQAGNPSDLFVIVYTPRMKYAPARNQGRPFRFFIATRQELQAIKDPDKQQPNFRSDWVNYGGLYPYEDCRNKFPPP
jgi:hypothetical protein